MPPAPLVGRDAELGELTDLLLRGRTRLLTLTGTGGTGKSRLAIELAARISGAFTELYWIDLTSIRDPLDVPLAIAETLRVKGNDHETRLAAFQRYFADRSCLLILDNFEQVLGAATFVADLIAACPTVAALVTSREALNLRSEQAFPLQPLLVPDVAEIADADAVRQVPSVVLFEERARARRPSFQLTDQIVEDVAKICVRLDGLPLAIELAAAQADILNPAMILRRLEARAAFVTTGPRDLPDRHHTLERTIGWSYDLLEAEQRAVFRTCGVFVGGFTIEALDAVRNPDHTGTESVMILAQLVAKSLVRVADDAAGNPRFHLLDTIRDFVLDQLASNEELDTARGRHAAYYVELAEALQPHLRGPAIASAFSQLVAEYGNFRAVFAWATDAGDPALGLRLAGALYRFWIAHGYLSEARAWLEAALARREAVAPRVRGVALNAAGVMAGIQHDHQRAVAFFDQSLHIWHSLDDRTWQARVYVNLGLVAWGTARLTDARRLFEQAQSLYIEVGDRDGQASALGNLALIAREQEDLGAATRLLHEALDLFRAIGDEFGVANTLANLGWVALGLEDRKEAAPAFREALQLRRGLGNTLHIAECFEGLAAASMETRPRRSARLLGAAEVLREQSGAPIEAAEQRRYERLIDQLRQRLRADTLANAWHDGRKVSLEAAIAFALEHEEPPAATESQLADGHVDRPETTKLSRREAEIAQLIALGQSNREIAEGLVLSINTVETHVKHLFRKLQLGSRAEIAAWMVREGLA